MSEVLNSQTLLVFDIGAHRGDDTEVYLQLGYKVIAIEANSLLIATMEQRFKAAIDSKQLIVVNCAVAKENNEELLLFVSADDSQSSLYKESKHSMKVTSRTLESLINEFGVPFFCKIDIEGSDCMAIQSLSKNNCPSFISVEISGITLERLLGDIKQLFVNLDTLLELGYTKFILVDQERLAILPDTSFYIANLKFINRIKRKVLRLFSMDNRSKFLKKFRLERNAEISGYPGYLLESNWLSYNEVKRRIEFHFHEYYSVASSKGLIFWVDLHASF